jgi:predicted Zn finger-like uncharacterized protein
MELTCPACSARYAVPVTAIPASGRLVRCSNCRAEWKAMPTAEAPPPSPQAEPEAPPVPPQQMHPSAPEVAEAPSAEPVAAEAREAPPLSALKPAAPPESLVARREAQGEEGPSAAQAAHSMAMSLGDEEPPRQGGGFLSGFAAVTLIALLGVTAYIKHGEIAAALPALDAPLQRYVAVVDQGRMALSQAVAGLREAN